MFCPYCKSKNIKVVDKRDNSITNVTRRRRECEDCHNRFTTYETVEKIQMRVKKRNGDIQDYDRNKIKLGILKAIKKRPITDDQIDDLIDRIETKIMNRVGNIISTIELGNLVLGEITKIDELGALLFASVYKEFQTIEDLEKELKKYSSK